MVSKAAPTQSINCTSCGAGLTLFGGGRVKAHACEYCGAVLDTQKNFHVLAQYRDLQRPDSPFQIGMQGELDGVEWTIIGTLGVRSRWAGGSSFWVEHQLFSPTHGYCWLSIEQGHCVFTRKIRYGGRGGWWTPVRVESADSRPAIWRDRDRLRYYESGSAEIAYAEGSFNWVPRLGERSDYVSFLGDSAMLTQSESETEREIEWSTYLERDATLAAFGARARGGTIGVHPLQPHRPWRHAAFARNAGLAAAALAAVLYFQAMTAGQYIGAVQSAPTHQPVRLDFYVTDARRLLRIDLSSNVNNSWAAYDVELLDGEGETVIEFERGTAYYYGVEGGESWSEGTRRARARLRVPAPGPYAVVVTQSEAAVDWAGGSLANRVSVTVRESVRAAHWLLIATIGAGLLGLLFPALRMAHDGARWSGSDWEDED